jgi:hypothetical protein
MRRGPKEGSELEKTGEKCHPAGRIGSRSFFQIHDSKEKLKLFLAPILLSF